MKRSMKLGDLLADLFTVNESDKNIEITGISIDNRDVNKGDLFIFHKGENFDPHSDYQAIENKAHAFINEKHLNTDLPQLITEDTRLNSSHVAIAYAVFRFKKKKSEGHTSNILTSFYQL